MRWYARQPRLVGAAEAAKRGTCSGRIRAGVMTRWLVTGAGGMLGRDLVAVLTARGEPVTGLDRGRPGRHRRRRGQRCASPRAGRTSWSTARPGPRSTTPRPTRNEALAVNGARRGEPGRGLRGSRRPPGAGLHRLRVRRGAGAALRGGRRPGAAHRLRAHQAGRGAGRARPPARIGLRASGPPGCTARTGRTSSRTMIRLRGPAAHGRRGGRPARPAHLDRRRGQADRRAGPLRAPRRASTTPPAPGRPPGSGWRARSSACSAPTRPGSRPITEQRAVPARRRGPPTACSATSAWAGPRVPPIGRVADGSASRLSELVAAQRASAPTR